MGAKIAEIHNLPFLGVKSLESGGLAAFRLYLPSVNRGVWIVIATHRN
jgi:hypothetical protein